MWIFSIFIYVKKIQGFNRETVSSITRKICVCDNEFYYKNVSKIRNIAL